MKICTKNAQIPGCDVGPFSFRFISALQDGGTSSRVTTSKLELLIPD